MLWPLLGALAFTIALILFLARRFDRLFAIEERRQAGLPYTDLNKGNPRVLGCAWAVASLLISGALLHLFRGVLGIGVFMGSTRVGLAMIWIPLSSLGVVAYKLLSRR